MLFSSQHNKHSDSQSQVNIKRVAATYCIQHFSILRETSQKNLIKKRRGRHFCSSGSARSCHGKNGVSCKAIVTSRLSRIFSDRLFWPICCLGLEHCCVLLGVLRSVGEFMLLGFSVVAVDSRSYRVELSLSVDSVLQCSGY